MTSIQQNEQVDLVQLELDKELRESILLSIDSLRDFNKRFNNHPLKEHLLILRNELRRKIYRRISDIRKRAKLKSIDFDLTTKWLLQKIKKGICEFTKVPISFDIVNNNHFEIDKINPTKGYIMSNCRVVTRNFNRMKGVNSDYETYMLAKLIVKNYKQSF